MLEKSKWFTGPSWLRENEDAWPRTSPQLFQQKTEDIEQVLEVVPVEKDIEWEKFGSFRKIARIFEYCLPLQSKIKGKVVMTDELHLVIQMLLRKSQMESFSPTYQALAAGKPMAASDHLNKVSSFMDDCRKQRIGGFQPFMADLPRERLEERFFPFTNTGVDYFGTFEVRFVKKSMKRCCCLFTCLTTRAVLVEVVPSLETDACLAAITRFIAQ